jgi:hypothetical protein
MQMKLNSEGTITTEYGAPNNNAPGPYLTLDDNPNSLYSGRNDTMEQTGIQNHQLWTYEKEVWPTLISVATGLCVGARPKDDKNVWARTLVDGSVAIVFINFNQVLDQNVTCDSDCFLSAGFSASATLMVRDIWAKADIGIVSAQMGYSVLVPREWSITVFKVYAAVKEEIGWRT